MRESSFYCTLIVIGAVLWKTQISTFMKMVWGFFLVSAAYYAMWPYYQPEYAPDLSNLLQMSAARNLVLLLGIPIACMILNKQLKLLVCFIATIDAVLLIQGKGHQFFNVPTFDAVILAVVIFNLNYKTRLGQLSVALFLFAIVCAHGRDALLVLAVGATSLAIEKLIKLKAKTEIALVVTGCILAVAVYWQEAFNDSRVSIWNFYMDWWSQNTNPMSGAGIGSFEWMGPLIRCQNCSVPSNVGFYLLHNDWLQILFETGWVGLLVAIAGFVYVALNLKGSYRAAWLGLGAGMIFYFPIHALPIQIEAGLLAAVASSQLVEQKSSHKN